MNSWANPNHHKIKACVEVQFWLVVLFSDRAMADTDYVEKAKLAEQAERYEDMAAVS